ncbi:MAG: hydroxyacid dehydrogenase [Deltaproteobacteria bacterium]|nr:hydroxyacid dehydrogenase [Deltaproteobacteria bacterium]
MKIALFEVEPWERGAFEPLEKEHELIFSRQRLTPDNARSFADAEVISPFIYSDLQASVLKQMENLRMIATRSTGFEAIDLAYCRQKGIVVSNVPLYGECTVAEHVFGLLLTISHKLAEAIDRTRKGDFSPEGLQGFDLHGKTLGVVGTGNIGRCVIHIARGFHMDVVAYDLFPQPQAAMQLGFRYAALDDLLAESDVITLHVPGHPRTRHLISSEQFGKMKRGAILINTARGNLVDIKALLHALAEGQVAAAGLDVLPEEPAIREEAELLRSLFRQRHDLETLLADHILLRLRNVFITPHTAFNTREAVQRILSTTMENILAFGRGDPKNVVT